MPHVIEPSAGADRATLAFLCEAYTEDEVGGEARTVLKFHPRIAPIKAAVFPLVKRDGMPEKAEAIYRELKTAVQCLLRREGSDRPALSPPGRGRHAVLHHRRRPDADRRHRHDPRPRQLPPVARRRRRALRRRSATCSKARPSPRVREASSGRPTPSGDDCGACCIRADPKAPRIPDADPTMKPCISQATTLKNPFEADLPCVRRGGWTGVELWLTKLETFLAGSFARRGRASCWSPTGSSRSPRRRRGACCSRGAASARPTGSHFRRRLALLARAGSAGADRRCRLRAASRVAEDYRRAAAALGEAAELAATFGVRVALEFQKTSAVLRLPRHGAGPGRAVRRRQCGRLPRRLPLLHRSEQVRGPGATCRARTWPGCRSAT